MLIIENFFKINFNEAIIIIDEVIYEVNNIQDTSNNNNVKKVKDDVLRMYENLLQIGHLDINGITNINQVKNITAELFDLIIKIFRTTMKKTNTIDQALKLYIHLIKSTISHDIIIAKQITRNKNRKYIYKFKENYNSDYT